MSFWSLRSDLNSCHSELRRRISYLFNLRRRENRNIINAAKLTLKELSGIFYGIKF